MKFFTRCIFIVFFFLLAIKRAESFSGLDCLFFELQRFDAKHGKLIISKSGTVAANMNYNLVGNNLVIDLDIERPFLKSSSWDEFIREISKLRKDLGAKSITVKARAKDWSTAEVFASRGFKPRLHKKGSDLYFLTRDFSDVANASDFSVDLFAQRLNFTAPKPGSAKNELWQHLINESGNNAAKMIGRLENLPATVLAKLDDSGDAFALSFLKRAASEGGDRFQQALKLISDEALAAKAKELSAFALMERGEDFTTLLFNGQRRPSLKKQLLQAMHDYTAKHGKKITKFATKYDHIQEYKRLINLPLSAVATKDELSENILKALDEYAALLPKADKGSLDLSVQGYLSRLDQNDYLLLRKQRPNLKLEDVIVEAAEATPLKVVKQADLKETKWLDDVFNTCKGMKSRKEFQFCLKRILSPATNSADAATKPMRNLFTKKYPCLAGNKLLLADLWINLGFFSYFTYSTFSDTGKEKGVPEDRQWREIPYEYIASVLIFAFQSGELACRAASTASKSTPFGKEISPLQLRKPPSTWVADTGALIKVKTLQVSVLSAFQLGFDRLFDRVEKRGIGDMLVEFPGKMLYFSVWGSMKNVAVTKYIKNGLVPWMTRTMLPGTLKHNLTTQLVLLTAIDKIGIGKLNAYDLKYTGEKLLFPIGEIVVAALVKKQSPEVLEDMPKAEREFINASEQALEESLKELGLTLEDLEIIKDEESKLEPFKIRIKGEKFSNALERFKAQNNSAN